MTQEEKDLLLKDLCARIPFGVKFSVIWVHPKEFNLFTIIATLLNINRWGLVSFEWEYDGRLIQEINLTTIESVKPYLFPLSSMTTEQNEEYLMTCKGGNASVPTLATFDWCIKNHFDYRGLIPMGLANDATGLNIY